AGSEARDFENAERCIPMLKNASDFRSVPARVAQLEGVAAPARQSFQKNLQPLRVHLPAGRKLKNDRTQFAAKLSHSLEELLNSRLGIFELLHVGQESAAL